MNFIKWFKDPFNQNLIFNWFLRLALIFLIMFFVIAHVHNIFAVAGVGLVVGFLLRLSCEV